jgi:hypothetical protein
LLGNARNAADMNGQLQAEGQPELPYGPEQLDISAAKTPEQAVARWWGNVILNPGFDNGASNADNAFAEALRSLNEEPTRADVLQHVDAFVVALEAAIEESERQGDRFAGDIQVDYRPDPVLVDAAKAAGMRESGLYTSVFPLKSSTRIRPDGTVVAHTGYRGIAEPIWSLAQAESAQPSRVRRALRGLLRIFSRH